MPRVDIFARDPNGYSSFHYLLLGRCCSISNISLILKRGVPINSVSDHYATPLHFAVRNPNCSNDVLQFMLENGAGVNSKDDRGKTPLHYVLQCYNNKRAIETFMTLLKYHVNVDELDETGSSALHYAVKLGYSKHLINCLIHSKADIYQHDLAGNSPFHYAIINGSWNVIKLFLNQAVDLNKPTRHYMEPLHLAALNRDSGIVKVLLSKGAWLNVVNRDNYSPLLLSALCNEVEVTKVLLEAGAVLSCGDCPLRKVMRTHNIYTNTIAFENVQLLLKYGLLEDAVSGTDRAGSAFSGLNVSAELAKFREECLQEVCKLQSVFIDHETTLGQFIFQLRWQMKRKSEDEVKRISDMLISHIILNTYPLYSEVMIGIIKREYLVAELENRVIYAVPSDPDSGVQESSILYKAELRFLTQFVCEADLLNLLFAFYDSYIS